jgi:hypothetical protein
VEWTKLVTDEVYVAIQVRVEWSGLLYLICNKLSPLHPDLVVNLLLICNKLSPLHPDLDVNIYLICNKLSPFHPDLDVNLYICNKLFTPP